MRTSKYDISWTEINFDILQKASVPSYSEPSNKPNMDFLTQDFHIVLTFLKFYIQNKLNII